MSFRALIYFVPMVVGTSLAHAAGPATGDIVAAACASCHGAKGEGKADLGFPALAGLPEAYILKQLRDFRAGTRAHAPAGPAKAQGQGHGHGHGQGMSMADGYPYYADYMRGLAESLSPEDMQVAARYFSKQKRQPATGASASASAVAAASAPGGATAAAGREPVSASVLARGRELAVNGAWDRQVPPCFKCHVQDGQGVAPHFPPIAGQHANYTVQQLQAWKRGERKNDPQQLMKATAEQLTEEEIRAVAAYLATMGPGGQKP